MRLIEELSTPESESDKIILEKEPDEEINKIKDLKNKRDENHYKGRRKGIDVKIREKLYDKMMRYIIMGNDESAEIMKKKRVIKKIKELKELGQNSEME
ncbi:hypothetical protein RhiirA1_477317 [Rhizophagus irregularis]|uniref:Uncharacterized protein n=1 Tax=Rhizophagus irregularis TaxID=588596 RepID=A0A2N0QTQ0_9GLOM|nr:hypothetical protein RhiirA1_477317 [Rhizophagus irregularis]